MISNTNRSNFASLRNALLVVCLDSGDEPQTTNETMYLLHSKNFANRWYSKSMQLVTFKNGVAGFVLNFLAGMTAAVSIKILNMVKEREQRIFEMSSEMESDEFGKLTFDNFLRF